MTDTAMFERLARVLALKEHKRLEVVYNAPATEREDYVNSTWRAYLNEVSIFLAELKNPTANMAIAGTKVMQGWKHSAGTTIVGQPSDIFRAMIERIEEDRPID